MISTYEYALSREYKDEQSLTLYSYASEYSQSKNFFILEIKKTENIFEKDVVITMLGDSFEKISQITLFYSCNKDKIPVCGFFMKDNNDELNYNVIIKVIFIDKNKNIISFEKFNVCTIDHMFIFDSNQDIYKIFFPSEKFRVNPIFSKYITFFNDNKNPPVFDYIFSWRKIYKKGSNCEN